ncbi:hypothetical protein NOR51B_994 [Luminiphilus syltensis NOR5-1B]|uniref:General secretion pathway protein K n=1 Tax=Luminiphilus syltensis NOR5-1B TaxID=565045 RepID=B8KWY7_9GAMM|nr:hypothetical protein [Luminiphilus syltensis]EED35052.1 hypothetical protein NOR51B_994 [Luminiphilus syltensis NOR5-1B]
MRGSVSSTQRGVALAVVVWFIAGMSLLVAGIVAEARVDSRMAQLHYFRAQATAAGDGAISLALADRFANERSGQESGSRISRQRIGDYSVEVRLLPATFLVNVSKAKLRDLEQLFSGVSLPETAPSPRALATAVVRYRDGASGRGAHSLFGLEDLLRVPGVDRGVYDAVRDFIVVDDLLGSSGGAQTVGGDVMADLEAALSGEGRLLDEPGGQPATGALRIDAVVTVGDQQWLRRRWVTPDQSSYSVLPWTVRRSEAAIPLAGRRQS